MSRFLYTIMIIATFALPQTAKASDTVLPAVIQTALHDAAATGNPLVVSAIADRVGNLFPSYRGQIMTYVEQVVTPAATIMANVDMMLADIPADDDGATALFDKHEMTDEDEAASLADDLNNIDVGSGIVTQ